MSEEGPLTVVFVWLFGLIASCFIGGMIGSSVNRFGVGLLLGILGPIGWIIVLLLPRDPVPQTSSVSNASKDNKTQVIDAPETRDLTDDAYKLYLAKKYSIERNEAFQKFVCDNKMFDSMDSALSHADSLETISLEAQERLKREQEAEAERRQKDTEEPLESDKNFFWLGLLGVFLYVIFIFALTS